MISRMYALLLLKVQSDEQISNGHVEATTQTWDRDETLSNLEFVVLLVPPFVSLWTIFIVNLLFTLGKTNLVWLGIEHDTNLRND